jgi:lipoate-protein ligase B
MTRPCELVDLGRLEYGAAWDVQKRVVERRKRGEIPDQLLIVEHPPVITMGRNGKDHNVLATAELLERAGIAYVETNRGGDVTFHGPGQVVGYPILDLREWKRDVMAYVRALEDVLIRMLAGFGIAGTRSGGETGVWTEAGKVAAIGIHISRWVTSHGFAINVDTDLDFFRYIVPCGLSKPVASMRQLGSKATRGDVVEGIAREFAAVFEREISVRAGASLEILETVST